MICIRNLRTCCIYAGASTFVIKALKNVGVVFMNEYLQHLTISKLYWPWSLFPRIKSKFLMLYFFLMIVICLFFKLNLVFFFFKSRLNYPLILTRSFRYNRHNTNLPSLLPLWISKTSESTSSLISDSLFKKLFYRYVNIPPV